VERDFAGQRTALLLFFRRIVRELPEAPDLAQKTYRRTLRIRHTE